MRRPENFADAIVLGVTHNLLDLTSLARFQRICCMHGEQLQVERRCARCLEALVDANWPPATTVLDDPERRAALRPRSRL